MEECGVLEIFGTADDAELLMKMAEAAEWNDLGIDWHEKSSQSEIVEFILEAAQNGEWLRLVKDESGDFEETRMACRAAGLSYIHSRGVSGGEGYETAAYWTPGRDKEFVAGLVHGMDAGIPFREIREALRRGQTAVEELVSSFGRMTLEDLDKRIILTQECADQLSARTFRA
jgi:hypothetical protein